MGFRVVPPSDANTATVLRDCLTVSGIDLCLAADVSAASLLKTAPMGVDFKPNTVTLPPPVSTSNPPPTPPPTEEPFVSPVVNLNPDCPPQTMVPVSGDKCIFQKKNYYSCEYMTSWDAPLIQCR